ncbi:MAG: quinone-dependent dihydroorotate dehydrogenase [Beijerinckiaceae bacterium]
MTDFYALAKPFLFAMDAEKAHGATIRMLKAGNWLPPLGGRDDPRLATTAFGLEFPNPLGMAAGFDKHAEVPDALLRLGFGFTEIGTVTPLPQPGNPQPRLFRLVEDEGVVNRFGFNSEGHSEVYKRLAGRSGRKGIVGVNVGANKDAADRVDDYVAGIRAFADVAVYFIVNISSPNTPGLRDLQQASVLDDLLARVLEARDAAASKGGRTSVLLPVLLKIAPDLTPGDLDDIVRVCRARGVDGMIVGNTTITRPESLRSSHRGETGGLSGKPLFDLSTRMLAETFVRVERQFPIIGAGGIHDAQSAIAKIEAGATLLQLYSALVYRGPALVSEIKKGLIAHMQSNGIRAIVDMVGMRAADWRGQALPGSHT